MKLLLTRDVAHLGIVGDEVDVANGYARNYLLPQGLAVAPTENNLRMIAQHRKKADQERKLRRDAMVQAAERINGVDVTIHAAANEEGVLYGSVGAREVASALREEGHIVDASNIELHEPIRRLDSVSVPVKLSEDITAEVKVWVVRSHATPGAPDEEEGEATE
jgi:large subunit ribosomal protein L9